MSASTVLREYAQALRGDWGSIDGRSERVKLELIANYVDYPEKFTDQQIRELIDVCPEGKGHWTTYCSPSYCGTETL